MSQKMLLTFLFAYEPKKKVNDDNIMMIYDFLFSELLVRDFNISYSIIITILGNALQSFIFETKTRPREITKILHFRNSGQIRHGKFQHFTLSLCKTSFYNCNNNPKHSLAVV